MDSLSYRSKCEEVVRKMGITSVSFSTRDTKSIMNFTANNEGFVQAFAFVINEPAKQVSISSRPSWEMPRQCFSTTLEFVTKLNYKLLIGHLDFDENDGEVRFKTSAEFGNARKIEIVVAHFMNLHVGAGMQYLKALEEIKDGASVRKALAKVGIDDYGPSGPGAGGSGDTSGSSSGDGKSSTEDMMFALKALGLSG